MNYLSQQKSQWEIGYLAPNVESAVFRFYGRILSRDFGITGDKGERILDFGCGQAAAVNYFHMLGFCAFGVDISEADIGIGSQRYPHLARRLAVIDPKPNLGQDFFGGNLDCIITIQTIYFLNDEDMAIVLRNFYENLKPGGVFYASMITPRHLLYKHSTEVKGGMRAVDYDNPRQGKRQFYMNFTNSEEEMLKKFSMFKPVHVGFYAERYRQEEGERHHYTFVGVKS